MNKLWKMAAIGATTTGLMVGGLYAHKKWEDVREHERQTTQKALHALWEISPEDQATIDAYNAMKKKWDQKIQKATDGKMNLSDLELRFLLSQSTISR